MGSELSDSLMRLDIERGEIQSPRGSSDQELLELYRTHRDEAAFAELVNRYGRTVWNVCRRVLVQHQEIEDAFQAVFLILVRKAATIRKGEAIGSWLYGVAFRTALRAKLRAVQRKDRDEQAAAMAGPAPAVWCEVACRELQRLLDEEVQGLAEVYRAPFVLCCLEGMSRAEAARELGWKEGTLSGRLARARVLLQARLLRRGVTLSAALTAGALAQNSAGAVASGLVATTTSALMAPEGLVAARTLSPAAVTLAELVLPSIGVSKLNTVLGLILLLALAVAGASLAALSLGLPGKPTLNAEAPSIVPRLLHGHTGSVHNIRFTPDGRLISVGGWPEGDRTLCVWDVAAGRELSRFTAPAQIQALELSANGRYALIGLNDGRIQYLDLEVQRVVQTLHGHQGNVSWLACTPDGKQAFSTAIDGTARLWDLRDGREVRRFQGLSKWVRAGAVSPDGSRLVIGYNHGMLQVWDVHTGQEIKRIERRHGWINWLAFAPNGLQVLIADREAALYDLDTGNPVRHFEGHADDVQQVALAPMGVCF